jgi:phage repressor protein C with HTH and peptisase S24 domain
MIIFNYQNKMKKIFNEMENILDRIKKIASNEGVTITAFEKKIGASKGVLSRAISNGTDIQHKWIQKIVENYPHYSTEWLLTGNGEILKTKSEISHTHTTLYDTQPSDFQCKDSNNNSHTQEKSDLIPLMEAEAVAGFGSGKFSIEKQDIQAYYNVPDFNGIDFMLRVKGNSMYPKYSSGDIIACRILKESKFIEWNKPHLIATTEHGLIVKRLRKSETPDAIKAISDNKEYDFFDIPLCEITGIAIIIGVIRLE